MSTIKVLGLDPSLRNWGIAAGVYNTQSNDLSIQQLLVSQPVLQSGKQVRQNSQDLDAATQHCVTLKDFLKEANVIFVEVPVGSQSARSQASYGICVGILGAINMAKPIYQVTPTEVKLVATGKKTATKKEMIEYASSKYPDAPWPLQTIKGVTSIIESKAEHMADAVATIEAGLQLDQFKQALSMRAA